MNVIVLSGKARSGKDIVAKNFKAELETNGESVLITHYADLLKWMLKKYVKWDGKKDEAGRTLLQFVGTDLIRNKANKDYWVDNVTLGISLAEMIGINNVIIPDARFDNEISKIKELYNKDDDKVIYIHVSRPGMESPLTDEQQKHTSENGIINEKPDFTIMNEYGLEELSEMCNDIIDKLYSFTN